MTLTRDTIIHAMTVHFESTVSAAAGQPFEVTGVHLPTKSFEAYADAILARTTPAPAMEGSLPRGESDPAVMQDCAGAGAGVEKPAGLIDTIKSWTSVSVIRQRLGEVTGAEMLAVQAVANMILIEAEQAAAHAVEGFDRGVDHVVQLLAKRLDVTDWYAADGSEDYGTDLGDTLMNIVKAKGLYDDEDGRWATLVSADAAPTAGAIEALKPFAKIGLDVLQNHPGWANATFSSNWCGYPLTYVDFELAAAIATPSELARVDAARQADDAFAPTAADPDAF